MNEIERALRDLGERTRDGIPATSLSGGALRRIKARRIGVVATTVLSVVVVAAGIVFASVNLGDDAPLPPTRVSPTPSVTAPDTCGYPLSFHANFIPKGVRMKLRRGSGSGADVAGVIAHYSGLRQGVFIDVGVGANGYAQTSKARIGLQLGATATVGSIEDGYSVEFTYKGCDYYLNAYGLEEATLRRFAENLVPRDGRTETVFHALWPDHTVEAAQANCGQQEYRRDSESLVLEFASEVMEWPDAIAITRDIGHGGWSGELRKSAADDGVEPKGQAIRIIAAEAVPGCWSVTNVSQAPANETKPEGMSVRVAGRDFSLYFAALGAASADVEIGYGDKTTSLVWRRGDDGVNIELPFEPDAPGHVLIILRDASGHPFSARSASFPAGDFAAG